MATAISPKRPAGLANYIIGALLLAVGMALADEAQWKTYTARAEAEFRRAQSQFQADRNNPTNAWQFARAAFDFAEFAATDSARAALAHQGIDACRQSLVREPKSAAAHYYLAMNLGQLARTEFLGALKLVKEMEREFKSAGELDPRWDYAGSARCLGLLYRDAPGWPASIGSERKARAAFEQAVKLVPDYPGNHLNLIESYLQWDEPAAARRQLQTLEVIWPAAVTNLTGEKWEQRWGDWTIRRQAALKKIGETSSPSKNSGAK